MYLGSNVASPSSCIGSSIQSRKVVSFRAYLFAEPVTSASPAVFLEMIPRNRKVVTDDGASITRQEVNGKEARET